MDKFKIGDIGFHKGHYFGGAEYEVVCKVHKNGGCSACIIRGLDNARKLSLLLKIASKLKIDTQERWLTKRCL